MKALFAALVLGIASTALHAQMLEQKKDRAVIERQTSEGPFKLDRVRPPETQRHAPAPSSPPSPAEQQRQLYEQRQPPQAQPPPQPRTVQCSARPVCGGGYGRCAAVAQTYPGGGVQSSRRDIVERCLEANTPDTCNCAAQCTSVARCSIF